MTVTEYLAELAYRLRWRHVGEARVLKELSRVADESHDSGLSLEERFGLPLDYARSIERGKSPSTGFVLASALVAIAIVVVAVRVTNGLILHREQDFWVSVVVYMGAVAWSVAATAVGARIDRRLPSGLR